MSNHLPKIEDVLIAAKRLVNVAKVTPLVSSRDLGQRLGCEVHFKPENLQETGSFKIRGAYNKIKSLLKETGASGTTLRGVVTDSSGNHGQGVAYASHLLGCRAVVVVPEDAVRGKVEAIKGFGAEVIVWGTTSTEREQRAQKISREEGLAYVDSYDDPLVIAGQGTVGLEIAQALPDVGVVLVPIGNGGLISGVSMAIKSLCPDCEVVGVEPEGSCCMYESRKAGRRVEIERPNTMADGLRGRMPGVNTFAMAQRYVDRLVTVSEDEIAGSFRTILFSTKMLIEPSGAASFAALLHGKVDARGKKAVAVISGGNIDKETLVSLL